MNIFKNMNKKQKKEFEKMPREQQMEMFAFEMNKEFNELAQSYITKSFYQGTLSAFHMLYENYVKELVNKKDELSTEEFTIIVAKIIAVVSKYNDNYLEQFPVENEKEI